MKTIIGLGKTGFSCAKFLHDHHIDFVILDTRTSPPYYEAALEFLSKEKIFLGDLSEKILLDSDEIILSPGVSSGNPAIQKALSASIPVIGDMELFTRYAKAPIAAITGTNAKSTVTTLLGEMAALAGIRVGVGGNLGTPVLDLLDPTAELYVLEFSSFQLESTFSLSAEAATILNVTPDHLDRYPGLAEYIAAKQRVYHRAKNSIFNREDSVTYPQNEDAGQLLSFGGTVPETDQEFGLIKEKGQYFLARGKKKLLDVRELQVDGKHFWLNALACLALAAALKLPEEPCLEALRKFEGLPHRCQRVAIKKTVPWYNDSKGTNIGATAAAIESFATTMEGKIILLAGGQGKHADFSSMRNLLEQHVRTVFLFGEDAPILNEAWRGCCELEPVADLSEAVKRAYDVARPGDRVLFSPACASFDMFRNFEHRGDVFTELVRALPE